MLFSFWREGVFIGRKPEVRVTYKAPTNGWLLTAAEKIYLDIFLIIDVVADIIVRAELKSFSKHGACSSLGRV